MDKSFTGAVPSGIWFRFGFRFVGLVSCWFLWFRFGFCLGGLVSLVFFFVWLALPDMPVVYWHEDNSQVGLNEVWTELPLG